MNISFYRQHDVEEVINTFSSSSCFYCYRSILFTLESKILMLLVGIKAKLTALQKLLRLLSSLPTRPILVVVSLSSETTIEVTEEKTRKTCITSIT